MPIIEGKYVLESSDKFDEYMKAVGVNIVTRKMACAATPTTEVSKTGENEYFFKTYTTFKTSELKFKLGETFKEETADGRTCQSTITMDGDRVKHVQECKGQNLVMYRDFVDGQLKMTLEAPNPDKDKVGDKVGETIVCTRIYKKVA